MTIQSLATNWKTTSAGAALIAYALVDIGFGWYNHTSTPDSLKSSILGIIGGVGLIVAGDASSSVTKAEADTTFIKKPDAAPLVPTAENPLKPL